VLLAQFAVPFGAARGDAKGVALLLQVGRVAGFRRAAAVAGIVGVGRSAIVPEQLGFGGFGGGPQAFGARGQPQVLAVGGVTEIKTLGTMPSRVTDGVGA